MGKQISFPVRRGLDETAVLLDMETALNEATATLHRAYGATRPGHPARRELEALAPQWVRVRALAGRALAIRREINAGPEAA